jgi:ABC-type glycerol-3-phosphate transport system substrate-binding protein
MQSGQSIYDGWISDSDLIGTHYRYGKVLNLTDYMAGAGKDYTNPGLDLADFIGTKFTTAPDGKLYQLPDQQFANLYWFRADLFARDDLKTKFKAKYGYDLGVPLNWSAYEDIAEFFSKDVKEIDGKPIYGHMDYGKKDPSLAGVSPTPGCRWRARLTSAHRTACRSTNGASAWPMTSARPWAPAWPVVAPPTRRPPSTRSPSTWTG